MNWMQKIGFGLIVLAIALPLVGVSAVNFYPQGHADFAWDWNLLRVVGIETYDFNCNNCINPSDVADIDKEDIETDLNTFVDIAGDHMNGTLYITTGIGTTAFSIDSGDANFTNVQANYFYGDGSGLTGLSSGFAAATLPKDTTLDSNATDEASWLAKTHAFSGDINFTNIGLSGIIFGSNANLDLNILNDVYLDNDLNVMGKVFSVGGFFGTYYGDGSNLTGVLTSSSMLPDTTLDTNGAADLNWLSTQHKFTADQNFVALGISGALFGANTNLDLNIASNAYFDNDVNVMGNTYLINYFATGYATIGDGVGMTLALGVGDLNVQDDIYTGDLHARGDIEAKGDANFSDVGIESNVFIEGKAYYPADRTAFDYEHELVDKEYVDNAVTAINTSYYLYDSASGVGDYKLVQTTPSTDAETSKTDAAVADGEYLQGWIAPIDANLTTLVAGIYELHITRDQTAGGAKDLRLYWRLVERRTDGTEAIIAISEFGDVIVNKKAEEIHLSLFTDHDINSDGRIVGKVYASVSGVGNAPTSVLYYRGATVSAWNVPTSTEILTKTFYSKTDINAMFVPYVGADVDVNLGVYGLIANDLNVIHSGFDTIYGANLNSDLNILNDVYLDNDLNVLRSVFAGKYFGDGTGLTGLVASSTLPKDTTCDNNATCRATIQKDSTLDTNTDAQNWFWTELGNIMPWADENILTYIPSEADIDQNAMLLDTNWSSRWTTFDANMLATPRNYTADMNFTNMQADKFFKFNALGDSNMVDIGVSGVLYGSNASSDLNIANDTFVDGDLNVLENVFATYYFGDGSKLQNLPSGFAASTLPKDSTLDSNATDETSWLGKAHSFTGDINFSNIQADKFFSFNALGDSNMVNLGATNIYATAFYGDGSGLTGVGGVYLPDTTCDNNADCTTWADARYVEQADLTKDTTLDLNTDASNSWLGKAHTFTNDINFSRLQATKIYKLNSVGDANFVDIGISGKFYNLNMAGDSNATNLSIAKLFGSNTLLDLNITSRTFFDKDINSIGSIKAIKYYGDGSALTGISGGSGLPDTTLDSNATAEASWLGKTHSFTGDINFSNIQADKFFSFNSLGDANAVNMAFSRIYGSNANLDLNIVSRTYFDGDVNASAKVFSAGGFYGTYYGDGSNLTGVLTGAVLTKDTTLDLNTDASNSWLGKTHSFTADINFAQIQATKFFKFNALGDANMVDVGISGYLYGDVDLNVMADTYVEGRMNIQGDLNITSPTKHLTGVSISADANRICFPSEECQMWIDYNGTALVFGS